MQPRSKESEFRHALRNIIHTMGLCLAVVDCEEDPKARIEWLEQIEAAADEGVALMDKSPYGLEAEGEEKYE